MAVRGAVTLGTQGGPESAEEVRSAALEVLQTLDLLEDRRQVGSPRQGLDLAVLLAERSLNRTHLRLRQAEIQAIPAVRSDRRSAS